MGEKFIICALVANHFGVLNRVAGLYAKRCYNIDSLAVGITENSEYSRMTIVSTGDEYMKEQVVKQLEKLHDVKMVTLYDGDNVVAMEQMLIKLNAINGNKAAISDLINAYGGKVLDFGDSFITAEITGSSVKIDKFVTEAEKLGIYELCRSGQIAMAQGAENMLSIKNIIE